MARHRLAGLTFCIALMTSAAASAQSGPTLSTMPRPPSFDDPAPAGAKGKKATKKPAKRTTGAPSASAGTGSPDAFERPNKFVPAEFDRGGRGSGNSGVAPMMTGSGRPGMGMRF